MPNAFTTRLPLIVSCRIWLRSASRERLFSVDCANVAPEFANGPHDQRNENRGPDGHSPINHEQNEYERDQRENLPEEIRQIIGKGAAHLLDVADHRGHHAADGIVVKESDRLLHQLAVHLIPQIRDAGEAHVLDQACCRKIPQLP